MTPKLIIHQKLTAFTNKYLVYAALPDGSTGELLALAQQKRLAFKEKVTFYKDEDKTQPVFTFRAEKVMDVHGQYFVEDNDGRLLGSFKKAFAKSLINSTWNIQDSQGQPKITVSESNQTLAVMRRFGGLVPILGPFVEIVTSLLRYHFDFKDANTQQVVGKYQKITLFRDRYILSLQDDVYSQSDWRVYAAMAVALDALQSR